MFWVLKKYSPDRNMNMKGFNKESPRPYKNVLKGMSNVFLCIEKNI